MPAYLREARGPDRGWALAALTDGLDFPAVKSSTIRNLMIGQHRGLENYLGHLRRSRTELIGAGNAEGLSERFDIDNDVPDLREIHTHRLNGRTDLRVDT